MAHGFEEVRREAAVMAGKHDDNYKTRLCTGFTFKHRCTKGTRCKDAHGASDLRWALRAGMCFVMLHTGLGVERCLWQVALALPVHVLASMGERAMAVQSNAASPKRLLAFSTALHKGSLHTAGAW